MIRWCSVVPVAGLSAAVAVGCASQPTAPLSAQAQAEVESSSSENSSSAEEAPADEITPAPEVARASTGSDLVREAMEASLESPEAALDKLEVAARRDREAAEPLYNMGVIYERMDQDDRAESAYRKALKRQPQFGLAAENLAQLYLRRAQPSAAIQLLEEMIQSYPNDHALRTRLCLVWIASGQEPRAEQEAKKILKEDEKHVGALVVLASIFFRRGQKELSVSVLERARSIDAQDDRVWSMLGHIYASQERLPEALEAYKKALEARWDLQEIHNNVGALYVNAQNFEQAIVHLNQAIALYPRYPEAYQNLGNALKGAQRYQEAEEAYKRALDLDEEAHEVLYNLGVLHLDNQLPGVDQVERWDIAKNYLQGYLAKGNVVDRDEKEEVQSLLVEVQRGQKRTQKLIEREQRQKLRAKGPEPESVDETSSSSEP